MKYLKEFLHTRKLSFKYAFEGLGYVFRTQQNVWIHVLIGSFAVGVGLWVGLNRQEWALIAIVIGLVLATEMTNTTLEALVDLISPDYHILAKVVKDTAAAAVFMMALISVVVGLLILLPPLIDKIQMLINLG